MKPYSLFREENEITDEMRNRPYPHIRFPEERCPSGYHLVLDHFRNRKGDRSMVLELDGIYVGEHCARDPEKS